MFFNKKKKCMSYFQQWKKHNSSLNTLKGNAVYCAIEQSAQQFQKRSNPKSATLFDVGLKSSIICFRTELTSYGFLSSLPIREGCVDVDSLKIRNETRRTQDNSRSKKRLRLSSWLTPPYSKGVSGLFKSADVTLNSSNEKLPIRTGKMIVDATSVTPSVSFVPKVNEALRASVRSEQASLLLLRRTSGIFRYPIIKIENLEARHQERAKRASVFPATLGAGEPDFILPQIWSLKVLKLEAWFALWKKWKSQQNIIRGFILNRVNGGYAVAIGRHIAFLPKSLRRRREERVGQYRLFRILNMRPDIRNIVVKEITDQYSSKKSKIGPCFLGKNKSLGPQETRGAKQKKHESVFYASRAHATSSTTLTPQLAQKTPLGQALKRPNGVLRQSFLRYASERGKRVRLAPLADNGRNGSSVVLTPAPSERR